MPLSSQRAISIQQPETDKYNPVKIPISVNNADCTDDRGCEELYDNSSVSIAPYNGTFNVKIYTWPSSLFFSAFFSWISAILSDWAFVIFSPTYSIHCYDFLVVGLISNCLDLN